MSQMIAALYARVSTPEQDPQNQLLRLRQYADAKGWIASEYIDVASGGNPRRPGLDALLNDCKKRGIDVVVATKIDRLARSIVNLLNVIQQLDKWGVQVVFLDQPIDTSNASGRLTLNILAALAEFEKELIHDRTMDGLARAAAEGRHGGRPKRVLSEYQIEKAKKMLAENPQISKRELCAQFNGISRMTLLRLLKEEGLIGEDMI